MRSFQWCKYCALQQILLCFNVWLPVQKLRLAQTFVVLNYSFHCRALLSHLDVTATNAYILQSDTSAWNRVKPKSHKGLHTDWCLVGKDYRGVPNRKSADHTPIAKCNQKNWVKAVVLFLFKTLIKPWWSSTSILLLTELVQLHKMSGLLGTDLSLHLFSMRRSCENINSDAAHPSTLLHNV